jgi:hypothetical protein
MAKQTFTTGQVLTAAQMTSLQQTAMGGGSTTAKTASYVLTAADAGTVIQMNSAGSTTITVNTGLFAAGDSVQIQNIGAGTCTVTAGTATVNTAGSLALGQYEGGQLYFNSTGAALFFDVVQASSSQKVVQVVSGTTRTAVASSSSTFADTGITATITPTSASNKIAVFVVVATVFKQTNDTSANFKLLRGATTIADMANINYTGGATPAIMTAVPINFVDSPATTSATTYKVQFNSNSNNAQITVQFTGATDSSIILMEITP